MSAGSLTADGGVAGRSIDWFLNSVLPYFDGNWVDICSVMFSLIFVNYRWRKRDPDTRGPFFCRDVGAEFANAASLFPLALLFFTIVSTKLTAALITGNKIILSIAGGFALFALLEDRTPKSDGASGFQNSRPSKIKVRLPPQPNQNRTGRGSRPLPKK